MEEHGGVHGAVAGVGAVRGKECDKRTKGFLPKRPIGIGEARVGAGHDPGLRLEDFGGFFFGAQDRLRKGKSRYYARSEAVLEARRMARPSDLG